MVRWFFLSLWLLSCVFSSGCNPGRYHNTAFLFKSQSIQDTLDYLLSQIDSVQDMHGNPIICFITIYENNDLCMIDFDVEAGWLLWPMKDSCASSVFGIGRYDDRLLWIGGNPKYKKLINEQLKLSKRDKILLRNKRDAMLKEHLILSNFHREYLFSPPDTLSLIKSGFR